MAEAARLAPAEVARDKDGMGPGVGESGGENARDFIQRRGIGMLRGEAVLDLADAGSGFGGEPARDVVMALNGAHDPSAAVDKYQRRRVIVRIVEARRDTPRGGRDRLVYGPNSARLAAARREGRVFVDPQTDMIEVEGAIVLGVFLLRLNQIHFVGQISGNYAVGSAKSVPVDEKRHQDLHENSDIHRRRC